MVVNLLQPAVPSGGLKKMASQATKDFTGALYGVAVVGGAVLAGVFLWKRIVQPRLGGAAAAITDEFGTRVA
ncbi:MAG: hypothetical protein ABR586_01280 [Thermoplasmatota archaeon]